MPTVRLTWTTEVEHSRTVDVEDGFEAHAQADSAFLAVLEGEGGPGAPTSSVLDRTLLGADQVARGESDDVAVVLDLEDDFYEVDLGGVRWSVYWLGEDLLAADAAASPAGAGVLEAVRAFDARHAAALARTGALELVAAAKREALGRWA